MSLRTPEELTLPVEIWSQVISFLTDEDIIHLQGVNRAFWNAALDILYGKLDLTENSLGAPPFWRLPSRLFSLPHLNRRLRHFRQVQSFITTASQIVQPSSLRAHSATVKSVSITVNIEFAVWCRGTVAGYLFDHVHDSDSCNPCMYPLIGVACVGWSLALVLRTLRRTVLLWPLAIVKPTFWGSILTAKHIASTLACLPNVRELEVKGLPPRPYFTRPNTFRYKKPFLRDDLSYLRIAFQHFGPTLVDLKLFIPFVGLPVLPSENSLPSLEKCHLQYGVLKSDSYEFLGCIASSLGASQLLQCVSVEANFGSQSFPSSFEIPLPGHLPNLRILRLTIRNLLSTSRHICEAISRYKEQLTELYVDVGDWNPTRNNPQGGVINIFYNALCTLFNPSVLTRLSISLKDRPEDMWFATLMTKLSPQVRAITLTHLYLDFPQNLSSEESLSYLPNLLSFTLVVNDIYLPLFGSMPINLPRLQTLKVVSGGKICSASQRACFVCAKNYSKLPHTQLAKELANLLDIALLSIDDWPLVHVEIWVISISRNLSETNLLKSSTSVFVEPLVRVFSDLGRLKDFKFIVPRESHPRGIFGQRW
ncbi:hypothetical protein DL96DRAFT_1816350 [Flagelloscypha sp. PMI_526]|nr:hypothetical protein DL96DRAFT_1816350 [Flagelloscypha sp. PMI_526]